MSRNASAVPYRGQVQIGHRYGLLQVMGIVSERLGKTLSYAICLCDCGRTAKVLTGNLGRSNTRSCGCQKKVRARRLYNPPPEKLMAETARLAITSEVKPIDLIPGYLASADGLIYSYCDQFGLRKYGCFLQANNGRNAAEDAMDECLDMAVYLQQLVVEWEAMKAENARLLAAIRKHRDQRGDDRCWMDDEELYAILPEGYNPPKRDTAVELANCERFIASRRHPRTEYVSPEREIVRLRAQVADYEALLAHFRGDKT